MKKRIVVILLFVVSGILIGTGIYFSLHQGKGEAMDDEFSSIPFVTFLSSNQEEKDSTLVYLNKFITDFDKYSTFSELDFEKLGGKNSNNCSGKIIMKNNNYVFDSNCQNERVLKKYSINMLDSQIKALDEEFYIVSDGYLLFGTTEKTEAFTSEHSFQLVLLKYDFNGTLQWDKVIDTNPDKKDLSKVSSFSALPYDVMETESGYSVFYIRYIDGGEADDLFLAKLDKTGTVVSNVKVQELDPGTFSYLGIFNQQLYMLQYIGGDYSLVSIDSEGRIQVKIPGSNVDLNYGVVAYDGESIYGVAEEKIDSEYMNEEDESHLKSIQKVNSSGSIEWEFDLQQQLKLKDYNSVSFEVAGDYLFLHVQEIDVKDNFTDIIYIFNKQGMFINKLDSPKELSIVNSFDVSYQNNFYYINFSENIDYGSGVIKKYDANWQEVEQYSYESAEKTITMYRNNTFFIYGYLKLKQNRYQLAAMYQVS